MVIAHNKQGTTEYYPDKKTIVGTYSGKADKDLALEHLEKIIDFYNSEKPGVKVAIIDVRGLYGSFVKLLGYLANSFYPTISQSHLKVQAIIVKDDVIVNHLADKLDHITKLFPIKSKVFTDMEEAQKWIEKVLDK